VAWGKKSRYFLAPFLASRANFAHFGDNLKFLLSQKKNPLQTLPPGNLGATPFFTISPGHYTRVPALTNLVFHSLFSAICTQSDFERLNTGLRFPQAVPSLALS
jgi:hypothetical protein